MHTNPSLRVAVRTSGTAGPREWPRGDSALCPAGGLLRERHGAQEQRGGGAGGLSELLPQLPAGGQAPPGRSENDPERAVDLPGLAGPWT